MDQPVERDGYCWGCKQFARLFLVAPWRYRCGPCSAREEPR
jgi:hypothetical protein